MKLKNLFWGALASLAVFAACEEPEQNLGTPDIGLSVTEMTFDTAGGEQTLTVTATRDWMVETDADWVVVSPESGSASSEAQTVTVSVLENTGLDREVDLKFTIGMKSKYLTVSQAGPGGSAEALIVYANDFDKAVSEKKYGSSGSSWPFCDQFDGWKNEKGTGLGSVSYAFKSASPRASSNNNNIWLPKTGGYLSIQDISLNGSTSFQLTFGTICGSTGTYKKTFDKNIFKIYVSADKAKWVDLPYEITVNDGFDTASATFGVPSGTEKLSITFEKIADEVDGYRIDDVTLSLFDGAVATEVDFSKGIDKDFAAGSNTGGGNTGDLPEGTGEGTQASPYDAAKATKVASALADGETKAGVYVKGIVKSFKDVSGIAQYGNISYYITDTDGAANFYVFRGKYLGNTNFTSEDQLKIGDEVVVYGDLVNYMGNTPELAQGNYIVSLNNSTEGGNEGGEDLPIENKTVSVQEFLSAEISTNVLYQVTGTIVSIETINSQFQNATFTMQDETGSLYVYRMKEETDKAIEDLGLTVGDELTVKGNRGDYNGNPQMVNGVYVIHIDKEAPAGDYDASIVFSECGYSNGQSVNNVEIKIDENITCVFAQGAANNEPAYYDSGSAIRMYQNGAILDIKASNGKTIKEIELTFGSNMYYLDADSGKLTAESPVRVWTGDASVVRFTATGTDKNHRAYVAAIKVSYE